ncbi:hypothetical protein [Tardiphaga robiniae]|uniref:Uncharacterized protein n=1 Tax=Tardiphaga robiniae TaxID=943830 RepID=A0A7G6U3Q2_9BRAD|nr:hypothetical protein [Tardiphaga robiniae]QND73634.1 hypothetical protein HB776_22345 [Tardiphaga robiniae]
MLAEGEIHERVGQTICPDRTAVFTHRCGYFTGRKAIRERSCNGMECVGFLQFFSKKKLDAANAVQYSSAGQPSTG